MKYEVWTFPICVIAYREYSDELVGSYAPRPMTLNKNCICNQTANMLDMLEMKHNIQQGLITWKSLHDFFFSNILFIQPQAHVSLLTFIRYSMPESPHIP